MPKKTVKKKKVSLRKIDFEDLRKEIQRRYDIVVIIASDNPKSKEDKGSFQYNTKGKYLDIMGLIEHTKICIFPTKRPTLKQFMTFMTEHKKELIKIVKEVFPEEK